jgi:hypothetical protein
VEPKKNTNLVFISALDKFTPPFKLCLASLFVFIAIIPLASKLNINDSPENVFQDDHPISKTLNFYQSTRGWSATVDLLFHKNVSADFTRNVIQELGSNSNIKQITNHIEVQDYFLSPVKDTPSLKPVIQTSIENSNLYRKLSSDDYYRSILHLKKYAVTDLLTLEKKITSLCPTRQCFLAGDYYSYSEFATRIPNTLLKSLALSLFLVLVVLIGLYIVLTSKQERSFRTLSTIILSSMWGPAVVLLGVSLFQIEVNYVTCVFASVLVGLAGDNAVQYIFAGTHNLQEGIAKRSRATVQLAVLTVLLPLCFLFAYFNPTQVLGILFSLGAIAGLVGDLWILKGLLKQGPLTKNEKV